MTRPTIDIPFSRSQWALLLMGLGILVAQFAWVIAWYPNLPETIPIHFNAQGEADGFGARETLFLLPIISLLMAGGLLWLSRKPHLYNYPVAISEANARPVYAQSITYMLAIHLWVQLLFALALFEMNPQDAWVAWPIHKMILGLVGVILLQTIAWMVSISKKA